MWNRLEEPEQGGVGPLLPVMVRSDAPGRGASSQVCLGGQTTALKKPHAPGGKESKYKSTKEILASRSSAETEDGGGSSSW